MKSGKKGLSVLLSLAMLATLLCGGLIGALAEDPPAKTAIDLNILDGTDTLTNTDKIAGWGGDISLYQCEASGLHIAYLNGGVAMNTLVDKKVFGAIEAPWISWNVKAGAKVEFVGSIHSNFAPDVTQETHHFRLQSSADGETWADVTIDRTDAEQFAVITAANKADYEVDVEGWYYAATLPADAIYVRAVYPSAFAEKSLEAGNHWQVTYKMMRTSGGTARSYETENAITGEALMDLNGAHVADASASNLDTEQKIGGTLPVLSRSYNSMPADGAAVTDKSYVTYRVKGGSPFAVTGVLNDDGYKFGMKFRLFWSEDGEEFEALEALYSVSGKKVAEGNRLALALVPALPAEANYVKVELPIDYNYQGMKFPNYKTMTSNARQHMGLCISGVYFDTYVAPPADYGKLEEMTLFYNDASYAELPALQTIVNKEIMVADIEFDPDTLEYSLNVPFAVEKLYIQTKAYDPNAVITGNGLVELQVGDNTLDVEIADGNTYTLKVKRAAKITASKTITADGSKDPMVEMYEYTSGAIDVTQKPDNRPVWNIDWNYANGKKTYAKPSIVFAVEGGGSVYLDCSTFDRALKLNLHFTFYTSADGETWTKVDSTPILGRSYGENSQMSISYTVDKLPDNAKLLKVEWPNDRDYTGEMMSDGTVCDQMVHWAPSIHSITLDWVSPFEVDFTDPGESDPGESDPSESDPSESDPGESDPSESDPGESEPGESSKEDEIPDTGHTSAVLAMAACALISGAVLVKARKRK